MARVALLLPLWLLACTGGGGEDTGEPLLCPGGGPDVLPIDDTALPTCADTEARYAEVVDAFAFCSADAHCQVIDGGCAWGIGGCYEFVNTCLDGQVIREIAEHYAQLDGGACVGGVCDCDVAPPVACVDGACTAVQ